MIPVFYIPGQRTAHHDLLVSVGLDLGGGWSHAEIPCGGPDAKSGGEGRGVLVYWPPVSMPWRTPNLNHYAQWHWTAAVPDPEGGLPAGRFWMGRNPGEPVTPEDLARRDQFAGLDVLLDDGQKWHLPVPRMLPHRLRLDETGRHVRKIAEPYEVYFDLATQFQRALLLAGSALRHELHVSDAWRLAVMGLGFNYRLNRDIVDWLELLTTEQALFCAACATFELDAWQIIEREKKTAVAIRAG